VQQGFTLDVLWTTSLYKQVSGFFMLGLFVLGGAFSARKRIRRLNFGSFASWRLGHAVVGVLALTALFVHTGFRLGESLDLWLGMFFLGSSTIGALTGLVVSMEHRLPAARAAWLRRIATRAHIWLLWPLPALILFHVVKAYYF
jgi:nitrite reductase (NADH) large subunit